MENTSIMEKWWFHAEGTACIWPFRGTGFWVAMGSYIFICIVWATKKITNSHNHYKSIMEERSWLETCIVERSFLVTLCRLPINVNLDWLHPAYMYDPCIWCCETYLPLPSDIWQTMNRLQFQIFSCLIPLEKMMESTTLLVSLRWVC